MIKIDFTNKIEHKYVVGIHGVKRLFDEKRRLHSYNDLPAKVWPSGAKEWYKHGIRHRDNGLPALIYEDGHKKHYENGKRVYK